MLAWLQAFWKYSCSFRQKDISQHHDGGILRQQLKSFTKNTVSVVKSQKYITENDVVLIIDDFLAHGEAALGLADIVHQAGAKLAGIAVAIEKQFQGGGNRLKEKGYRLESLAIIESIVEGKINFA